MFRYLLSLFFIAMSLVACAAQTPTTTASEEIVETASSPAESYKIGVDDIVQVNVWRNDELSMSMPVRPDGKISMPLIGDVVAGGKTPEEVATDIRDRLAVYIKDPNVTVILTELRNNEYISRVRVTGAVTTPMSLPYRQGMTVLDAVLAAGGINEFAAPDRAKLYRRTQAGTQVMDVQLGGILHEGKLSTNHVLKPGDIITVPERLF
jgi:polysaccharide export outer membrane protein